MLTACTRLGPHEVLALLGSLPSSARAGEMGEACQARDTKLGRNVAVKILSEAQLIGRSVAFFWVGALKLQRFARVSNT